ncbi:putative mRNA 3-end processing factor [Fodinibius roseus]|uniref:Putative mRNA 3-end processing factor n=1 Tax=Fodinibius roseus TaxID=1194090 RepID=A0A1M4XUC7_9BACT|nr:MBL fold metallo-hydrolase [Fodinibius roseus]SHE97109.1 putative mRNA 3-end processing factor [Fodinibius roseus]
MNIIKAGSSGVLLPDLNIEFDCSGTDGGHTFISHAHADHMPRSKKSRVYCTAYTRALMRERGFEGTAQVLEFGTPLDTQRARITLYPAGHILGSAMVFVESERGNVLYTGDCRIPPSPASEGFALPGRRVDHLVTEATFALPIYKWDSHEKLASEVRSFASDSLKNDFAPVFLAYDLGKAQEIMQMLAPLNRPLQISRACYNLCKIYERAGFHLGSYETYTSSTCEGKILIASSHALNNGFPADVSKKRIAYCSGWATGTTRFVGPSIDKMIPLSDHLDFFELIELCKGLRPEKVYLTHTPNASVVQHYLDNLNIDSRLLE